MQHGEIDTNKLNSQIKNPSWHKVAYVEAQLTSWTMDYLEQILSVIRVGFELFKSWVRQPLGHAAFIE